MRQDDEAVRLTGGHVVDAMTGVNEVKDLTLRDGRFCPGSGGKERVLDVSGLMVLPGLVDAHVHIANITRGSGWNEAAAFQRLVAAGVTTAVEYYDFASVVQRWNEHAPPLSVLGLQGVRAHTGDLSDAGAQNEVAQALAGGAIGMKLLGGHFPNTPTTAANIIAASATLGAYCAFHAGTTTAGSNVDGMRQIMELAAGHPVHVAHTNAYLRGATAPIWEENITALQLLTETHNVVSESHLADLNLCLGDVTDGELADHVTRNCLRQRGYTADPDGLEQAFLDGYAHAMDDEGHYATSISGARGRQLWRERQGQVLVNFPVNDRLSGFMQATARTDTKGSFTWTGPGEFVVDAIASDGGAWRNVSLERGVALIRLGALTWEQLVEKVSLAPAQLYGLTRKGHLAEGADADVAVVDPSTGRVVLTVASGHVVYGDTPSSAQVGKVLTTAAGEEALRHLGCPVEIIDLEQGRFRKGRRAGAEVVSDR